MENLNASLKGRITTAKVEMGDNRYRSNGAMAVFYSVAKLHTSIGFITYKDIRWAVSCQPIGQSKYLYISENSLSIEKFPIRPLPYHFDALMLIWILIFHLCSLIKGQTSRSGPIGPLTDDFQNWLVANGYETSNFDRPDIGPSGSFGGKRQEIKNYLQILREPVIFVHGNADAALYIQPPLATGWSRSIQYFLEQNYTSAELYATTWGDTWSGGSILTTYSTMHTCSNLIYLRKFLTAVLDYTGAPKVDIIAHSLAVPLMRKVLKGGSLIATDGNCVLGKPLGHRVDTFWAFLVQITVFAFVNWRKRYQLGATPWMNLNNDPNREADHVYAMWSDVDEVLLFRGMTWGKSTSRIPGMNGRWVSDRNGHIAMKDLTELRQYEAVVHHSI
ncbi:Fasting Induced Lipase [Dirofilaria immitis]|nr:Fasting Induced Lipase [Dirofilaria immitis]